MKKKVVVGLVMAGALTVGITGAIPSLAANNETLVNRTSESTIKFGHGGHKEFNIDEEKLKKKAEELGIVTEGKEVRVLAEEIRLVELQRQAKELGIETEDKDVSELVKEIKLLKLQNQAKELGIEITDKSTRDLADDVREAQLIKEAKALGITTDGKGLRDLAVEVREAQIKKQANELGIEIEGKDFKDLANEVHEEKIIQAAKKLGIETTDKTTEEIVKEIFTNYAEEADKLDLVPGKHEGFGGFHHGGHKGSKRGHGHLNSPSGNDTGVTEDEKTPTAENTTTTL